MRITWETFAKRFEPHDGWRAVEADAHFTPGLNLHAVARLAWASRAKRAIEIGTAHGHTTVALARSLPAAEIVTVGTTRELAGHNDSKFDVEILPEDIQGHYIREQEEAIRIRILAIVGKPEPRVSLLSAVVGLGSFEFAYIDGDHRWECVAEDTKAVLRRISDDGIIVWDDYGFHVEVRDFINTLNARVDDWITEVEGTRIVFVQLNAEKRAALLKAAELL